MHFVQAKGILSAKNGMNLYRGCTHGCIYCDSRSECYTRCKANGIEMNPDKIFSHLLAFENKQTSAQLMLF
ncbi:radical SAM domain protein [Treponema socranskii subsp. socranskii VPI DR56BR1116 = ATCC 35536]|uniref:Radical SAM domain protein n=1 Tax=Treponema socranskii subsp. socranskii VPI DR56BR1116 = ATCC 35536 TaxID=1125725 RepID=U1FA99_TRESO|nr:radical SAM domain protein [Treponema socranskii subsp. socranskii VPI DR56BR1116 = ATCC 35536]ERK05048.1 radical SAM domain protein [Treponema socranskii subsp. socranskii VPI DR56BR1116 = ATCC 35536]